MVGIEGQGSQDEMGEKKESKTNLADNSYQVGTSQGLARVSARQETTRAGHVEPSSERFPKGEIDFSGVQGHLAIHTDGEVAGSQFSGDMFPGPEEIIKFIGEVLPNELEYDQFGRIELTLEVGLPEGQAIGFAGVKSLAELQQDEVPTVHAIRTPGGEPGELDGVRGAWYPETIRDESGAFVVATNEDGTVKNPRAKFEPEAIIAEIVNPDTARTTSLSVVIQKDIESGRPVVLTAYPGEIAPPFPVRISTESFQLDTLHGTEADYWSQHAFLKFAS